MSDEDFEKIEEAVEETLDYSVSQLKGLGAATEKKLQAFGVMTLYDLCVRGSYEIQQLTGAKKETADEWVFKAKTMLEDKGYIRNTKMKPSELLQYKKKILPIKSNHEEIDDMFGGGLYPESLYEIYGEFGSGKTQFCYTLTAELIAKGEHVIWIDCEDTFKPERLIEILIERELVKDEDEGIGIIDNVVYLYTPNTENLMGTVNNLTDTMLELRPKLVILDGSVGQFREEYLGRGTLAARQNQLARLMTHLKNISFYFVCTILFTNQVQTDPSVMFGDPIKPIGGNVVGHASTYRLYFKKSGKKHIARMVDSPEHPTQDVQFALTAKGIDVPE
jgi:DNA repair protein RadA